MGMQRQSSIPGDAESRALRAEAALEALKVKSQGAAKQYEEVRYLQWHLGHGKWFAL